MPIKAKNDPIQILKRVIPNVRNVDYLDWQSKTLPIIARPLQGLGVLQLFTLMVGTVPRDRICLRKPTSVTCNSIFVIDLSYIHNIEDLRADDSGVWLHGGKPML